MLPLLIYWVLKKTERLSQVHPKLPSKKSQLYLKKPKLKKKKGVGGRGEEFPCLCSLVVSHRRITYLAKLACNI